ncbi:hypothetical protein E2C01_015038 [Portunus trituberculatus]|uniref:Uncharacterized protein n=1 Tax=Portunus trituberculatus TaxID=210409 RepID=A0A5B7DKA4_PORTR|nr:hypothetical protein [Portunus trituberculatus]
MTRLHIHSAYYLVILHSFRNSCVGFELLRLWPLIF